jgi:hypothetical protein
VLARPLRGLALVCAVALATVSPAVAAGDKPSTVKGHWTNPVGACVKHLISFDAATGDLKCTGTSKWTGTWKGSTKWTFTGNMNPSTGETKGHIDEVFTGKIADGRKGKLTFVEKMTLDKQGNIDIHGHIVKASGGLAGAKGKAHWTGTSSVADGSGAGPYSGSWHKPPRKHRHQ